MNPAAIGMAESARTIQYGRAARTESSHGALDCHSRGFDEPGDRQVDHHHAARRRSSSQ